jgi:hypothetical protein
LDSIPTNSGRRGHGRLFSLAIATVALLVATTRADEVPIAEASGAHGEARVRDRLWLWGHAAGVYNNSYLASNPQKSQIGPVEAAKSFGLRNMMFIRYDDRPALPFDGFYKGFRNFDRVVWSLTGAGGITSREEQDNVFRLAEKHDNLIGLMLDDFLFESEDNQPHWLAANNVQFPVLLTLRCAEAKACDRLVLIQSEWHSGDYRTADLEVHVSADGERFRPLASLTMPNRPGAEVAVRFDAKPCRALRLVVNGTHDVEAARSCGLKGIRLFNGEKELSLSDWRFEASSEFPQRGADQLLRKAPTTPYRAALLPDELATIRRRFAALPRPVPIGLPLCTNQLSTRATAYINLVDEILLCTWDPSGLKELEVNLERLEELAPNKTLLLGCYMFDFHNKRPLPLEQMQRQTELGYRWLRSGRIAGMVFIASPVCDLDLDAVKWTKRWIEQVGDRPLTQPND